MFRRGGGRGWTRRKRGGIRRGSRFGFGRFGTFWWGVSGLERGVVKSYLMVVEELCGEMSR